jgi:hypothetical protein
VNSGSLAPGLCQQLVVQFTGQEPQHYQDTILVHTEVRTPDRSGVEQAIETVTWRVWCNWESKGFRVACALWNYKLACWPDVGHAEVPADLACHRSPTSTSHITVLASLGQQ